MESVLCRVVLFVFVFNSLRAIPINPEYEEVNETDTITEYDDNTDDSNKTAHDLYVIRTVIYEVGILTDADNNTDYLNETHEQVDIRIYDPEYNISAINLSNILAPLQTNVSGQVITGIAPANFGIFSIPPSDIAKNDTNNTDDSPFQVPILPQIVLSHTTNFSTTDPEEEKIIIAGLPEELGI